MLLLSLGPDRGSRLREGRPELRPQNSAHLKLSTSQLSPYNVLSTVPVPTVYCSDSQPTIPLLLMQESNRLPFLYSTNTW